MFPAACLLVLSLLTACGARDPRAAFVDTRPPPALPERFYPPEGWAWGLISVDGGPVQRYGVSAPGVVAKGQVLILPDYGETAETWFETARDLNVAGYTVWILEGVGQGGSERLASPRDLGELRSFAIDRLAARAMAETVIRPDADRPLVILGEGVGAYVAARAAETGARPTGLILSGATCERLAVGHVLRGLGFGGLRAPGAGPWRRAGPDDFAARRTHDAWRGGVTHAWQMANPDLRMGGPSLDWQAAFAELHGRTLHDLARLDTPTVILDADRPTACLGVPGADRRRIAGARPALELEDEGHRRPWLTAVEQALARMTKTARRAHGADHGP